MQLSCFDFVGTRILCVQMRTIALLIAIASVSANPDGSDMDVDLNAGLHAALPLSTSCEVTGGTVMRMCNGKPFKKWGVGSEGQAAALKNCQHASDPKNWETAKFGGSTPSCASRSS